MSKAYEFLKECGAFFVLSINGDYPAGRPFGAVMEVGDDLYLSTNDMNDAHKQMRENEHIQIVAKKAESREWLMASDRLQLCQILLGKVIIPLFVPMAWKSAGYGFL